MRILTKSTPLDDDDYNAIKGAAVIPCWYSSCFSLNGACSKFALYSIFSYLNTFFMLRWTITFLVIAVIAAILGFTGVAAAFAGIAKVLFVIFLILFILSFFMGKRNVP
ncbi:DUF1328 domain-containing protein [Niabella agricola]